MALVPTPDATATAIPPAIWVGAIGVIIGAGFGVVTSLINNFHQRALARDNDRRAARLAREANRFTLLSEDRRVKRERLEEAHQLLSFAAQEFSLTNSTHFAEARMSVNEWNERYRRSAERLHRLQMIADLYVPSMSDTVRHLYGRGNVFWGQQQGLLYQISLNNPNAHQTFGQAIVEAAQQVSALVGTARQDLVEEAGRLEAGTGAVTRAA